MASIEFASPLVVGAGLPAFANSAFSWRLEMSVLLCFCSFRLQPLTVNQSVNMQAGRQQHRNVGQEARSIEAAALVEADLLGLLPSPHCISSHSYSFTPAFSINYMGKRSAPLAAFPTLSSNHSSSSLQSNCPSSTMDKQQQQPEPRFTPFPAPQRFIACDDPDQYKCGFVTHVQSATLLIGSLGSLAAAGVMASLIKANAEPDQCVLAALILISYALLVLGWISRMPSFYWVFLIINPLVMCLCAVFCTYPALDSLLAPIVYPAERIDFMRLRPKQQLLFNVTHSLRVMELISSLSAIFLLGYFQSVVFRAHNWQRKKNRLDEQLVVIVGDQTP